MRYQYDDIALSVVDDLNTRLLNMSFSKLIENDQSILPINEYIPKIWENKWFNNKTIDGYSLGDAVWKYTMTQDEFLLNYHDVIYEYAKNNQLLNGYFRFEPSDYIKEIDRYNNVISGYSSDEPTLDAYGNRQYDPNTGKLITHKVQYLPPLFDYGAYSTRANQPIEIYVSLIDDNKELLSNSQAWTKTVLSNINEFKSFISNEISLMFTKHINDYHLGGLSTNEDFSEILIKKDFSNFDISALYNTQRMISHTQYINDQGFDYVRFFKRDSVNTKINVTTSKNMPLYRWCRLWNSGHLEHGGIIEIPKYSNISSNESSCYNISIDLAWADDDRLFYDYPISEKFYGSLINDLYFSNTAQINNYELSTQLAYDNRYSVSLTPVQFNNNDLEKKSTTYNIKLINEDDLLRTSYPTIPNNDKNKTFVNYEVYGMTNKSFCITRSRTDDLMDNNTIRYIQYYVSGYRSSITLQYNIQFCTIENLRQIYPYTGEQIRPTDFIVRANNGDILTKDMQYKIYYGENINTIGYITIEGISPFYGKIELSFYIKHDISDTTKYSIINLSSAYPFI